jgi:hypothetical protein
VEALFFIGIALSAALDHMMEGDFWHQKEAPDPDGWDFVALRSFVASIAT